MVPGCACSLLNTSTVSPPGREGIGLDAPRFTNLGGSCLHGSGTHRENQNPDDTTRRVQYCANPTSRGFQRDRGGNVKPRLLVFGDIGADILLRADRLPAPGSDAAVRDWEIAPGGSAANCAIVASRLGTPTDFIGFIGTDEFGKQLTAALRDGPSPSRAFEHLTVLDGKTGITVSLVDSAGERTFLSCRGVNASGRAEDLPLELCRSGTHLHLSGYSFQDRSSRRTADTLLERAATESVPVSLDPSYLFARDYDRLYRGTLEQTALVFPNREEAALITGFEDPEDAAKRLLDLGPETAVIKLGSQGCLIARRDSGEILRIPAIVPPRVVDTTGAGDAFCAGFLTGLIAGVDIRSSAVVALAAASVVVASTGATTGAPAPEELDLVLRKNGHEAVAVQLKHQRESYRRKDR